MKKVFTILAILIVVVFLALMFVPKFIDWQGKIAAMVRESTGRELRINGEVRVSILPTLKFFASDIYLSNALGMQEPDLLSIRTISGTLRLWPLLGRRVVIDSFVVHQPSVHLAVDTAGRANWVLGTTTDPSTDSAGQPSPAGTGLPIKDLSLGDVRISQGTLSFINARTGHTIRAKQTDLTVALPTLASPLTLKLRSHLNGEPVSADLSVDSPHNLLTGLAATVQVTVASRFVTASYQGDMQQQPVPGLNGTFHLDVPSVGQLAAWLEQPLDPAQPDPGSLVVRATFTADGAKVALTEATIEAEGLQASATGSYDGSGEIAKVVLNVESDRLNIDRYLLPAAEKKRPTVKKPKKSPASGDPLAALSDEPFDLGGLKKTTADVQIAMSGIEAMGYKIGRIALTTSLKNGLLTAELQHLDLYGGNVKGTFKLDGSGNELGVEAALTLDGVQVDDLAQTATDGGLAVNGTASGNLIMQGQGVSPKALVEHLSGKVAFNLSGVDLKKAEVGSISGMKVDLDLPGMQSQSRVKASVVYNKERVNLDLKLAPIKQVLSGNPFAVQAAVASKLLNAGYDGTVQLQPVSGLDGTLSLDVASVARLMQWLGQPLEKTQPDPGPLKLRATFEAQGSQAVLKQASIEGKALQVQATGSVDNTGTVPVLMAKLQVEKVDLNAYLPASEQHKATPAKQTAEQKAAKQEPSGWSEEPLALSPLAQANADIHIDIGSLRYGEITVQSGRIKAVLKNGVLHVAIDEFQAAGGTIASTVKLDASGPAASLDYQLSISGLEARPLLQTFAHSDRLSGTTEFQIKGSAQGRNQKELVHSLNGGGQFAFLNGAIHGINIAATLRKVKTLGLSKTAGDTVQTDFAELSGSFVLKDGMLENRDLKMLAPLVRLSGGGLVPLPKRAVDYDVTATLVPSFTGQGGKDALAGVPIPIKVKGPWEHVSYKVNWKKVFGDISADPERLKHLPQNLRDAGKSFGVDLPLPKLPDVPKLLDTGQRKSPLDQLLRLKKELTKEPAESTTSKKPEEKKKPLTLDPSKALKGLFKR